MPLPKDLKIAIIGLGYATLLDAETEHEYKPQANTYDAIILAVAHPEFLKLGAAGIHAFGKPGHVRYDAKSLLDKAEADGRL